MVRKSKGTKRENDSLQSLQALGFILFLLGFGIGITSVIGYFSTHFGDQVDDVIPAAAEAAEAPEVSNSSPIVALILVILGVTLIAISSRQRS